MSIEIENKTAESEALNYAEIALDEATGDIKIPITIIRGADAVVQRLRVRFRFFLGEWFLDTRLGVPYFDSILVKNPDKILITSIFRRVIRTTPGVKRVDSLTASLDRPTRTLTTDFRATLDDDITQIVAKAEPFIL